VLIASQCAGLPRDLQGHRLVPERSRRSVLAAAFIASDRAGAVTGTVANLSAGSITD
jgi:hypothetical protein